MSLATHRAAIAAALNTVPDIGQVHDHEPYGRTEVDFRSLYGWTDASGQTQVRGWFLQRTRTAEGTPNSGRTINTHTWRLRAFMSLDEAGATELTFDALVEAARKVFRDDPTLGGAVDPGPLNQATGLQVTDSGPAYLAGVLCHVATLTYQSYEYLDNGE